jgi:hypothetical protein
MIMIIVIVMVVMMIIECDKGYGKDTYSREINRYDNDDNDDNDSDKGCNLNGHNGMIIMLECLLSHELVEMCDGV